MALHRAVLFDLTWTLTAPVGGDELFTPLFQRACPAWRALPPGALAQARGRALACLRRPLANLEQERQALGAAYGALGAALPALGLTPGQIALLAEDRLYGLDNDVLLPQAAETLQALRRQGYRVGVAAAAPPSAGLRLARLGLDALLDCRLLAPADAPETLYRRALARLGLPGERCALVSAQAERLQAAAGLGLRCVQSLARPGSRGLGGFPTAEGPAQALACLQGGWTDWGDHVRPLTMADVDAMLALQGEMAAALPSPRWYFTSTREEFAQEAAAGRALGVFLAGELIAFAIAQPAGDRPSAYAHILGLNEPRSLDFQDIIVSPRHRRRGIHSYFLARYEAQARAAGMAALYATVDPENVPSLRSFEKAGWRRVAVRRAYDGRVRAYYRKGLTAPISAQEVDTP